MPDRNSALIKFSEFILDTVVMIELDAIASLPEQHCIEPALIGKTRIAIYEYFNHCYRALIRQDDARVVVAFRDLLKTHSGLCLLRLAAALSDQLYCCIDYKRLDSRSLAAHTASVRAQLTGPSIFQLVQLTALLRHRCDGWNIRQCDPTAELFRISLAPPT